MFPSFPCSWEWGGLVTDTSRKKYAYFSVFSLSFSCLHIIFRPLQEGARDRRSCFLKDNLLLSSHLWPVAISTKHPLHIPPFTLFLFLSHLFFSSSFLLFMCNFVIYRHGNKHYVWPRATWRQSSFYLWCVSSFALFISLPIWYFTPVSPSQASMMTQYLCFLIPRDPHSFFFLRDTGNNMDQSFLHSRIFIQNKILFCGI